jgi:hypothetical protein
MAKMKQPGKTPPSDLPAEGRRLWLSVTEQYPADHFQGANGALLENLCRAHALIRECDNLIAEQGAFCEGSPNPALAVRAAERRSFMALSTKLRLSISAIMRADDAGARPDAKHALRKPWEPKR